MNQGYDKQDISIRFIGLIIGVSIVILVAFFLWSRSYFITTKERIVYEQTLRPKSSVLLEYNRRDEERLTSFGVIDSTRKIYQIPIDLAIDLVVKDYTGDQIPDRSQN